MHPSLLSMRWECEIEIGPTLTPPYGRSTGREGGRSNYDLIAIPYMESPLLSTRLGLDGCGLLGAPDCRA